MLLPVKYGINVHFPGLPLGGGNPLPALGGLLMALVWPGVEFLQAYVAAESMAVSAAIGRQGALLSGMRNCQEEQSTHVNAAYPDSLSEIESVNPTRLPSRFNEL